MSGVERSLEAQLTRIERARSARRARPSLADGHITLSHGSGGKATHDLIDGLIAPAFANPLLDPQEEAAVFATAAGRLAFTTDSYVVSPLFFPGGDIGRLAVHGTVNDLAMMGAQPRYLSVGLILEEGLEIAVLRRVVESMAAAAAESGVHIVTGDTKVVPRGKADRLFITTSGVGIVPAGIELSHRLARPGDQILLSGTIGDHGMAVMLAREAFEFEAEIASDTAPLTDLVRVLLEAAPRTRALKDPTRGGVATSLNEIAVQSGVAIVVEEEAIPVRAEVRGACEILGIEALHIANEGKLLAVVPMEEWESALEALRSHPLGRDAARVGTVVEEPVGMVILKTGIGGSRVLDMLVGDPLPRIC